MQFVAVGFQYLELWVDRIFAEYFFGFHGRLRLLDLPVSIYYILTLAYSGEKHKEGGSFGCSCPAFLIK